MATHSEHAGKDGNRWRIIGWSAAGFLLALPFVAMQLTSEVNWNLSDFLVFGAMLAVAGAGIEFATRRSGNGAWRAGAAVAVVAAFLLVWVNLAVGLLRDEDNVANGMFIGVIGVALLGSAVARFEAKGMAKALFATAAAQLAAGLIGLAAGYASPGASGVYQVAMGSGLFCGLWILSALLFRKAAQTSISPLG